MTEMLSNKPYLIRAFYEWIVDSQCTPYISIDTTISTVSVPTEFIEDDEIILNLMPGSIKGLEITNDDLFFKAHFGGVEREIYAPIGAIKAIYAMENGQGMMFEVEETGKKSSSDTGASSSGKPHLHIVE